ncbi:Monooxygenase FAD-binding [Penicillium angulare]|uniref:Monooxygenase FAD-binding n=1 Tax=Penicillium angulare TaxID=116970 RepID=UPI0025402F4D|nr:Monooxygenase FAD-binding [Penicillium angulare]KAJ5263249.1 Monooxygenase FAD-binding [Penicillium angulare]
MEKQGFRVIIVGGSVAGLTLAQCLRKHNIEYVVLEARDDIAPQEGASISIMPNASLALDQLGILDDILDEVEPLRDVYNWDSSGKLLCKTDVPFEAEKNHAYAGAFLTRQTLLQILYKHMGTQKDKVLTGKRVTSIEHHSSDVLVRCADGSSFRGDIVVGADGIRSEVREQMWKHMDTLAMEKEVRLERERMTCEYNCVFGIASPIPGMPAPDIYRTYGDGWGILVMVGKNDKVYFFFFTRLDRKYGSHEIPRYKKEDIHEHIAPYLNRPVTDIIQLSQVYNNAEVLAWLPLEEALYKFWCMDRFVCIGDSAHKMTPNAGVGANSAIESAVSLSNTLATIAQSSKEAKEINHHLQEWEKTRRIRLEPTWKMAASMPRLETLEKPYHKIMKRFLPLLISLGEPSRTESTIGAEIVNCLPPPTRSYKGLIPYKCHDDLSAIIKEKPFQRLLWSLPLLGITGLAFSTMGAIMPKILPQLLPLMNQGWNTGTEVLNLSDAIIPIKSIDNILRVLVTFFLPSTMGSDLVSRTQTFTFLTDANGLYGIWLLESYRKAHSTMGVILPITMGILSQLRGMGLISPIYSILQYNSISLQDLAKSNNREIEPRKTYTTVLSIITIQALPALAMFLLPSLQDRKTSNAIWQFFPILVPALQIPITLLFGFSKSGKSPKSATPEIRSANRTRSIKAIRVGYGSFAAIAAVGFTYARFTAPAGSWGLNTFWPGWDIRDEVSLYKGIAQFLQWDQILTMGTGFAWLALRFRELKKSGVDIGGWKSVLGLVGGTFAVGPGAAFALAWGWKEELIHGLDVQVEDGRA